MVLGGKSLPNINPSGLGGVSFLSSVKPDASSLSVFPTSQNVITFFTGSHQISSTVVSFVLIVFAG